MIYGQKIVMIRFLLNECNVSKTAESADYITPQEIAEEIGNQEIIGLLENLQPNDDL